MRRVCRAVAAVGLVVVVAVAVGCGGGGGSASPAPVSWWRGEGNARDAVGTNDGVIFGGVTYGQGAVGKAFDFNGTDGDVAIVDSPSLALTHSLTLDARIRVDALPPASQNLAIIVMRGDTRIGLDPYLLALYPDGIVRFHVGATSDTDPAGQAVEVTGGPIALGQWVRITGTLDDATGAMKLYINGTVADQTTTSLRPLADLDPGQGAGIGIGNHPGFPATVLYPFNGAIDEVKIYNKVVAPGG